MLDARYVSALNMHFRRLRMEPLEDRRLLAPFSVTNLMDGAVTAAGQRPGTLRQAIFDANALAGPDVIFINITGTINLFAGQLNITEDLIISGLGRDSSTINARESSRIINFNTASVHHNLTVYNLTIRNGKATSGLGGGINFNSTGTLTIEDAVVTNNSTTATNAHGGAIYSLGTLIIEDAVITNNSTTATSAHGGGIYSLGALTVTDSVITQNETTGQNASGGGIYAEGTVQINNSVVSENIARGSGGGIRATSTLAINNSTVYDNGTTGPSAQGGGIHGFQDITIIGSTISGNHTSGQSATGGGIFAIRDLEISHSTITENYTTGSSAPGGGIAVLSTAGTRNIFFDRTLLAGNTAVADHNDLARLGAGTVTASGRYNLFGSGIAIELGLGGVVADPRLGPLQNNGGPTPTHSLLPDSPAIDSLGTIAVAGVDGIPLFDQRGTGYTRVSGSNIDIGAFELQVPTTGPPPDFDGDGDVDGRDFLRWQRGFGTLYNSADLTLWRNQYGEEEGIIDLGFMIADQGATAGLSSSANDAVTLINEPQLLELAVDEAFDNWTIPSRSLIRDFGDIAVNRDCDSSEVSDSALRSIFF